MTKHVHAELMMQYAQDATETDKPWERWELKNYGGWERTVSHPAWDECVVYRRKPKCILINGIEVPEPMREAPELGTPYWIVDLNDESSASPLCWIDDKFARECLQRGICHLTEKAAVLHTTAILSFTAK